MWRAFDRLLNRLLGPPEVAPWSSALLYLALFAILAVAWLLWG
jgi:hypothetical protein